MAGRMRRVPAALAPVNGDGGRLWGCAVSGANSRPAAVRTNPGDGGRPSGLARWLGIAVRTGHLGTAAVYFGGALLRVQPARLAPWLMAALVSGALLLVLELLHDRRWPHRGKGLLALAHAGLVLLLPLAPGLAAPVLWLVLVSGSVGSHMPRCLRHWSILDGPEQRSADGRRP